MVKTCFFCAEFEYKPSRIWSLCYIAAVLPLRHIHGDILRQRNQIEFGEIVVQTIRIQLDGSISGIEKMHCHSNGSVEASTAIGHWNISVEFGDIYECK